MKKIYILNKSKEEKMEESHRWQNNTDERRVRRYLDAFYKSMPKRAEALAKAIQQKQNAAETLIWDTKKNRDPDSLNPRNSKKDNYSKIDRINACKKILSVNGNLNAEGEARDKGDKKNLSYLLTKYKIGLEGFIRMFAVMQEKGIQTKPEDINPEIAKACEGIDFSGVLSKTAEEAGEIKEICEQWINLLKEQNKSAGIYLSIYEERQYFALGNQLRREQEITNNIKERIERIINEKQTFLESMKSLINNLGNITNKTSNWIEKFTGRTRIIVDDRIGRGKTALIGVGLFVTLGVALHVGQAEGLQASIQALLSTSLLMVSITVIPQQVIKIMKSE